VRALTEGGQKAVSTVNTLQGKINTAAGTLGSQTSKAMYDSGIQAAQGLLKGMKSKESALYRQARRFAREIARAVKKELGIKSPSRVFRDIGKHTTDGLVIGLDAERVKRRGAVLATALEKGFSQPELDAHLSQQRAANAGATVTVQLTAQQLSEVQQGREIQLKLDAYKRAGGRVAA